MENGVGMLRNLFDHFHKTQKKKFPKSLLKPKKATLVTAALAGGFIAEHIMPRLSRIKNFSPELVTVRNKFYGESITVTGLLTGQDIFAALEQRELGDAVFLPHSCVNDRNMFLDDWKLSELERKLGVPVVPLKNNFSRVFEVLEGKRN